jgi:hypothetical protein
VVAGGDLAGEGEGTIAGEGGEEQGRLNLGGGDGELIAAAREGGAADGEGGAVAVVAAVEGGAEGAERGDDTALGAGAERGVAGEDGEAGLAGEEAGEQAQGGAGVAAVEDVCGLLEAAEADAGDGDVGALLLDLDAEGADAGDGGEAVGAREEVGDAGVALGDGVKDDGAVGDRLIAGDLDRPAEAPGCREGDAGHCRPVGWRGDRGGEPDVGGSVGARRGPAPPSGASGASDHHAPRAAYSGVVTSL